MELIVDTALGYTVQFVDFPSGFNTASLPYFGLLGQQHLYNMSGLGIAPDGSGLTIPESLANDPVTKAVYDNIMGNISKKPKVTVFCEVCNLEFSSQVVLDTHLAGSKHQRKIKAKELLKSLEETESGFERNPISGVIRCTICDVTVNSPQLLATHVAGNKHRTRKNKRTNGDLDQEGPPTKKLNTGKGEGTSDEDESPSIQQESVPEGEKKIEKPPMEIPPCVSTLEDKTGSKYLCNPCQAHCNSEIQLAQHLGSKKHLDKLSQKRQPSQGMSRGIWRGSPNRGRGGALRGRGGHLRGQHRRGGSNQWTNGGQPDNGESDSNGGQLWHSGNQGGWQQPKSFGAELNDAGTPLVCSGGGGGTTLQQNQLMLKV